MENYPTLKTLEVAYKKVLLRADLDVDFTDGATHSSRLNTLIPTVEKLLYDRVAKIIILGHRGRPGGKPEESLSLKELTSYLSEKLPEKVFFAENIEFARNLNEKIVLLENLRFWSGEETNDPQFAQELASGGEVFVNDAFASSHRPHASIVGIPKILKSAIGLHFEKEVENLSKVIDNPKSPIIAIIGGAKKDKLEYLEAFKAIADKVLVGGRLPEFLGDDYKDEKVLLARLLPDKEDITIHSMEMFEAAIRSAATIVLAGPMGLYEDNMHTQGTKRILEAVANNKDAFKVAGGGDTATAIKTFGQEGGFDWISSGGGASLDFLVNKTLPGLEALLH